MLSLIMAQKFSDTIGNIAITLFSLALSFNLREQKWNRKIKIGTQF